MDKLNFDWRNRFKDMYIDNKSGLKNFIRFDWTKESKKKKDEFNQSVDKMIQKIIKTQDKYNQLVDIFAETNSRYVNYFNTAKRTAQNAERDPNTLQSKILSCRKILFDLKKAFKEESEASLKILAKLNSRDNKIFYATSTGKLNNKINSFNSRITMQWKQIYSYRVLSERLNGELNLDRSKIKELEKRISEMDAEIEKLQETMTSEGNLSQNEKTRLNKLTMDKRNLTSKLDTQKSLIFRTELELKKYQRKISDSQDMLKKISREVYDFNGERFNEAFNEVNNFTKNTIREIDEAIVKVNDYQKRYVKQEAANAFIATSKTIINLDKKIKALLTNFKDLDNFAKINNAKYYDSKAFKGFFVLLKSKIKTVEMINSKVDGVNNIMDKVYKEVDDLKSKVAGFSLPDYTKTENINNANRGIVESILEIEKIQNKFSNFKIDLKNIYDKITMPIILLENYEEGYVHSVYEGSMYKNF